MKCRFCHAGIDPDFDDTKSFKGVTYFVCPDDDCRTLNHFKGEMFIFYGGTAENRHKGRKCLLDIQLSTDPKMFLVDFLDGTKEICNIDNLQREIEDDI